MTLGPYLGELTDELKGEHITTFVSGGPKNYAYRTNTGKVVVDIPYKITRDTQTKPNA